MSYDDPIGPGPDPALRIITDSNRRARPGAAGGILRASMTRSARWAMITARAGSLGSDFSVWWRLFWPGSVRQTTGSERCQAW